MYRGFLAGLILCLPAAAGQSYRDFQRELRPLEKTAAKYKHRLHLDAAGVAVRLVDADELDEGTCGAGLWDLERGFGLIEVLRRSEYAKIPDCKPPHGSLAKDQQNTVIHELIHLLLKAKSEEHSVAILTESVMRK